MTATEPIPDHGDRAASAGSGYDETLPSHLGDVIVRTEGI
jgi:hypothetical protein